jgi:NAD(P)-dependent dehydrogenase (short-subunit alcohol dehydrogenase family)
MGESASTGKRVAVVTGATSGIGEALARRLATEGWRVIGSTRDVAGGLGQERPPGVELRHLDLVDPASIDAFAKEVLADCLPDALINNAGQLLFSSLEEATPEQIDRLLQVNLRGPMALTRAFVPGFRERGSGVIVNVSSLAGRLAFPFFGVYASTKHGLEGFSESLWFELRPFGVRVKLIEPGFVATPIWPRSGFGDEEAAEQGPYTGLKKQMVEFERRTARYSSAERAAGAIVKGIDDRSYRLRYGNSYATPILALRGLLGSELALRLTYRLWRAVR